MVDVMSSWGGFIERGRRAYGRGGFYRFQAPPVNTHTSLGLLVVANVTLDTHVHVKSPASERPSAVKYVGACWLTRVLLLLTASSRRHDV
jgi:hypothetical protein